MKNLLKICLFLFPLLAFGQAREIVLCDNQATKNCFSWDITANLGSNMTITGPILPLNGETSGTGRGTMTGQEIFAGGFGAAGTIALGSNIDAKPDTAGTFGAAQSANDCTIGNVPAWSAATTYNIGDIAKQSGVIYTSIVNSNLNHVPPNASFWVAGCTDDRTRVDWFGFEGVFHRIKAHGTGNTEIGDYFDWTRYGATNALPVHQLNLNDSGFNTILHIDEGTNFLTTNFDHSGQVRFGLNSSIGVTAGIAQHTCTPTGTCGNGMLEVNTGTIGTLGQLTALGLDINQNNDNSGYQVQVNGGIEMVNTADNILSKGTARNAVDVPSGGAHLGTALYLVNNASAPSSPSPTTEGALYYAGGGTYQVWTGSAWVTLAADFWSRNAGGWVFPTTTTDGVTIGTNSNDGSGYLLQVNGGIEMIIGDTSHNILSKGTNTFNAISAPSGGISAGFASTDLSLSVGSFVGSQFEAITATTNASIMGMGVVAATRSFLASGRSGTGTFLAMAFDTNNSERMRINTSGQLLINRTTDDGSGSIFEVSGSASVSANYLEGGATVINTSAAFVGSGGVSTSGQITTSSTATNAVNSGGGVTIASGNRYWVASTFGANGTITLTNATLTFTGGLLTGCSGSATACN